MPINAFAANAAAGPAWAMSTPLNAGPAMAPSWDSALFRPMAGRSAASPTTSLTKTCRVGWSTAAVMPKAMQLA